MAHCDSAWSLVRPRSEVEAEIMASLVARAEAIKGKKAEKGEDNILKIMTEGLQLATDVRLLNPNTPFNPNGKIAKAVDNIHRIWAEGAEPALSQIVFLDSGVPGSKAARRMETAESQPVGEDIAILTDSAEDGWYRYHALFADLLRATLRRRHPDLVDEMHQRAAGWMMANGRPVDAERHARLARDWPLVGRLAVDRWLVADLDDTRPVPDPAARVPASAVSETPALALVGAAVACIAGDRDTADLYRGHLDRLLGGADTHGDEGRMFRLALDGDAIRASEPVFAAALSDPRDDDARFNAEGLAVQNPGNGAAGHPPLVGAPGDKDRRVGKSVITFHVTPKAHHKNKKERREAAKS